jgi:hypothetical protein
LSQVSEHSSSLGGENERVEKVEGVEEVEVLEDIVDEYCKCSTGALFMPYSGISLFEYLIFAVLSYGFGEGGVGAMSVGAQVRGPFRLE